METGGKVDVTLSFFMVESIFSSTLLFFLEDVLLPLNGGEKFLLHLSLFKENELVTYRFWSRVTTTPHPPLPSSLHIYGEGKRGRSESLFLYGREYLLLHPSLFIKVGRE